MDVDDILETTDFSVSKTYPQNLQERANNNEDGDVKSQPTITPKVDEVIDSVDPQCVHGINTRATFVIWDLHQVDHAMSCDASHFLSS